jgi:hypothetical protein
MLSGLSRKKTTRKTNNQFQKGKYPKRYFPNYYQGLKATLKNGDSFSLSLLLE